jgi:hypothetical protein
MVYVMSVDANEITLTFPRSAVGDVLSLSAELTDRLHELLERNTDGALSAVERAELATLVHMSQFSQLVSMALKASEKP